MPWNSNSDPTCAKKYPPQVGRRSSVLLCPSREKGQNWVDLWSFVRAERAGWSGRERLGTRFRWEGLRCRVRGVDSFGLREVNAEEKPELFSPFPWNVEMGRVYGTLRLLGFPRLRFETNLLWTLSMSDSYRLGLVSDPVGPESRPCSSVSSLLWRRL